MSVRRHPSAELSDAARVRLEALRADLLREAGREESADAPDAGETWEPRASPTLMPVPGRHAERRPRTSGGRGGHGRHGWQAAALDRLPAGLVERPLGTAHVAVLAVVCGLLVTAGAWWALQLRGEAPVAAPAPSAGSATSSGSSGDATQAEPLVDLDASAPGPGTGVATPEPVDASGAASGAAMRAGTAAVVVVDVAGRVRRPGLATLPAGSRVADAIDSAGGARRGVDLTNLNLARVLVDGEQVLVGVDPAAGAPLGVPGVATGATPDPSSVALVNLNTADQPTLETLPGVGPVTAAAILQWRTDHGAFTTVEELLEVSGIGPATLEDLAPLVTV
ncbi:helix-hairpin-helix domain-containing protein [Nocardioidaceae bacterium]|nr:helix-hairpin-helix domain-containing protein [Nocardioidaceae bacterium]